MTDATQLMLDEALDLLADMVGQHCYSPDGGLDSMALSANAAAMRFLTTIGRIRIEREYGRRVIGQFIDAAPNPQGEKKEGG